MDGDLSLLIVEDHAVLRATLRARIHASFASVRVLEAGCGEDGIAVAVDECPQLVLMDIGLPGIDGIEATRLIKARLPGACVVVMSIHDDQVWRLAAAAAGATAFVSKRGLPGDLMRLLDDLVPRLLAAPRETRAGAH